MVMLFARMLASYSLLGSSFIIVTVPYISMYEIRYDTFAWFSLNCPHWLTFANRYEEMLKSSK